MPFGAKRAVWIFLIAAMLPASAAAGMDCRECHSGDAPTRKEPALAPCPRAGQTGSRALAEAAPVLSFAGEAGRYGGVRFAHKAHAEMAAMGEGCAACHHHSRSRRVESCDACHSKERLREDPSRPDLKAARHRLCIDCHRSWAGAAADCASCHEARAAGPSPSTGWLNHRFHGGLSCAACHREPGQFVGRKTECASCHAGWPKGFKHESTGQGLDETHAALDCTVCHAGKGYSDPPACSTCHDDRAFPAQKPGPRVPAKARR